MRGKEKTEFIAIKFDKGLKEKLQKEANRRGISMSELIRQAIINELQADIRPEFKALLEFTTKIYRQLLEDENILLTLAEIAGIKDKTLEKLRKENELAIFIAKTVEKYLSNGDVKGCLRYLSNIEYALRERK